jgi:hypothetical protein
MLDHTVRPPHNYSQVDKTFARAVSVWWSVYVAEACYILLVAIVIMRIGVDWLYIWLVPVIQGNKKKKKKKQSLLAIFL